LAPGRFWVMRTAAAPSWVFQCSITLSFLSILCALYSITNSFAAHCPSPRGWPTNPKLRVALSPAVGGPIECLNTVTSHTPAIRVGAYDFRLSPRRSPPLISRSRYPFSPLSLAPVTGVTIQGWTAQTWTTYPDWSLLSGTSEIAASCEDDLAWTFFLLIQNDLHDHLGSSAQLLR
jgi:hypothetical protein